MRRDRKQRRGWEQLRGQCSPHPTHLPSPEALAQGFNLLVLQLLEKGAHLQPGRRGVTPAGPSTPHPTPALLGAGGTARFLSPPPPPPTVPTQWPGGRVQVKSWLRTKQSGGMQSCPWMAELTLGM